MNVYYDEMSDSFDFAAYCAFVNQLFSVCTRHRVVVSQELRRGGRVAIRRDRRVRGYTPYLSEAFGANGVDGPTGRKKILRCYKTPPGPTQPMGAPPESWWRRAKVLAESSEVERVPRSLVGHRGRGRRLPCRTHKRSAPRCHALRKHRGQTSRYPSRLGAR